METEDHEETSSRSREASELPRGSLLPLNSKRLTQDKLRQLARALELPTAASSDDLRQLIAGKLEGQGRQPMNVQVILRETASGPHLSLQDEDGMFLEAEPPEREGTSDDSDQESEGGGTGAERNDVGALQEALREADEERKSLRDEVSTLRGELEGIKLRIKELWRSSCEQLAEFDAIVTSKDEEIASLKQQLSRSHTRPTTSPQESDGENDMHAMPIESPRQRRGRAPPIDPFTGENPELRLDDWLPSLRRAAQWNRWSREEELMQLAGHLRGRALQEWNLLGQESLREFDTAVRALRERLDPGYRVLAGQDFRHTRQGEVETVADFVRRLERDFQIAYGSDKMGQETREVILHGQMQDGLRLQLMRSPSVSGALTYKQLCMSAKNEERRQTKLRKRQDYLKQTTLSPTPKKRVVYPLIIRLEANPFNRQRLQWTVRLGGATNATRLVTWLKTVEYP